MSSTLEYYYDDATQDQWQQKKSSKEEGMQKKMAKFDPESKECADDYNNSHASAMDVMKNRAKVAQPVRLPGATSTVTSAAAAAAAAASEEEDKEEELKYAQSDEHDDSDDNDSYSTNSEDKEGGAGAKADARVTNGTDATETLINDHSQLIFDDEGNEIPALSEISTEFSGKASKNGKRELSEEERKKKQENLAKLREKLSDKINTLREKRRAPGSKLQGAPKSRDQILAERKERQEMKRQESLKRKHAELEEDEDDEEEEDDAAASSDSDADFDSELKTKSVVYGNIVFNDGSRVTSDLGKIRSTSSKKKHKGPANNDIKAHLLKLEQKNKKLALLSPQEQQKQREQDKWNKAISQVDGIKVKDDATLLKKALKKKEKQKLKSEIEWKERKQIVKDTVAAKQKRREENLKARRESKGKKNKKQPKLRKFAGTVNKFASSKKKRAGFEGSTKTKAKRTK